MSALLASLPYINSFNIAIQILQSYPYAKLEYIRVYTVVKLNAKNIIIYSTSFLVLIVIGFLIWYKFIRQPVVTDPFNSKILSSISFALYYPSKLPTNFKIAPGSASIPQTGVVIFTLEGPSNEKIYMSEEARPDTFNLGGYYKDFEDLKETIIGRGTIAVGYINNHQIEVGSLAINNTWILTNTTSRVPLNQLTNMLSSLIDAH